MAQIHEEGGEAGVMKTISECTISKTWCLAGTIGDPGKNPLEMGSPLEILGKVRVGIRLTWRECVFSRASNLQP